MSLEITVSSTGFGDHLVTLSALCNIPESIVLCIPDENLRNTYTELKKIFCIDDTKLSIVNSNSPNHVVGNWHLGTICNYIYPTKVSVHNRIIDLPREPKRRHTIGLACYSGTDSYIDRNDNLIRNHYLGNINDGKQNKYIIPRCKVKSLDYYSNLFYFLRTIGYDVVTLDHPSNLETKVEQLLDNCAAVIGYEGGIAHLCTMLQVPYIMLNWNESTVDQYKEFQCEMTHQSHTTFFLKNDNEIFSHNEASFNALIDKLNCKETNNRFLTKECYYQYNQELNRVNIFDRAGNKMHSCTGPFLPDSTKELINKYNLNKWK